MNKRTPDYVRSDAWLLQAIALAASGGPAELKEIIAAGDWLNHAIFTLEELQGGLMRLLVAGCLRREGQRFDLSPNLRAHYYRWSELGKSNAEIRRELEKILKAFFKDADTQHGVEAELTEEAYVAAVRAYREDNSSRGMRLLRTF